MKAVVELGGRQYLVEPGAIFLADKLPAEKGDHITIDKVLMILDGDEVVLGKPYVENARVTLTILDQTKLRKIMVQKFRPKKGYLKTRGHRQHASQVQVELIEGGGKREERVVEKKKRKKKETEAAEKPAPSRSRKKPKEETEESE
jgi:large subunit ribosomal protein L21